MSGVLNWTALRWRSAVITRILATAIVLILAFGALWSRYWAWNMSGILLVIFASTIWYKWDMVRDPFIANTGLPSPMSRRLMIRKRVNSERPRSGSPDQ